MTEIKHTPTPWSQDDNQIFGADGSFMICTVSSSDDFPCIDGDDEQDEADKRAECDLECAANAALIVEAVNSHASLQAQLAALEAERDGLRAQNDWLKDQLSKLNIPLSSRKNIEEWLSECGMPPMLAALSTRNDGGDGNG